MFCDVEITFPCAILDCDHLFYCIASYCIASYCIILQCIVLHYIVLHCIVGLLGELSDPMDIRSPHTGIPSEALTLYCPDEHLKVSILQEFLLIDQKYTERIDNLDEYHADIVW